MTRNTRAQRQDSAAAKQLAEWTAAHLTVVYAWTLYGDRQLKNHLPDSQYQRCWNSRKRSMPMLSTNS